MARLLIGQADPDLAPFLRLAAVTGARRSELCALRWADVDFVNATLNISRSVVASGPGYGQKGTWNGTLQACLPLSK